MANIKSFPNNQDEAQGAEDVMRWHHGRTSGVFGAGNNASVQALSTPGMAVEVSDGTGWMANSGSNGVVWWIDNESVDGTKLQLAVDAADGGVYLYAASAPESAITIPTIICWKGGASV